MDLPGIRPNIAWYAASLANFHVDVLHRPPRPLNHFWSLAVEEQFYLVWPAVVLLAPRRFVLWAVVAMIGVAPISRLVGITLLGDWFKAQALPSSCFDGLGMGALLALSRSGGSDSREGRDRLCSIAAVLGSLYIAAESAISFHMVIHRTTFTLRYLAYAMVSVWLVNRAVDGFRGPARWLLEARPLTYLGKISYGVYVLHLIIPFATERVVRRLGVGMPISDEPGIPLFLYVTATSVALASISWYGFEGPLNRLKRYFDYR